MEHYNVTKMSSEIITYFMATFHNLAHPDIVIITFWTNIKGGIEEDKLANIMN